MIPYGRQDIQQSDIDAVMDVLQSNFLTQGDQVPAFEAALAKQVGAGYGVAMNSATSALHLACIALDLGPGDLLWTSPITFVASANAGLYCGAKVDFVDINPQTYNMCPRALASKLEQAKQTGTLPKIVIPVHLCGQSCDMQAIHELSKIYSFKIIEDASHAVGGEYQGHPIGDCRYSDITIFSFHPVKIITTAEGGMAVTNQAALADRMELLRSHGITRDPAHMTHTADGPWYYQQIDLGFNYRMTEIQAALGISQLVRLNQYVTQRRTLAARYDQALADFSVQRPVQLPDAMSAWHLYIIRLVPETDHLAVFNGLRAAGIGVNLHYIPVHTQPYYKDMGFRLGDFPQAEAYYTQAISLPLYATLSMVDQDKVLGALRRVLS